MPIRRPAPLRPGDTVAVTSPSSGVTEDERARLDVAVRVLEDRGLRVVVGDCMDGSRHVSAPAPERARELETFLTDPHVRAVVPPWGGVGAIELLPLLDWDAIAAAEPTWFVGLSDTSTLLAPMTLLTGVATVHGNNLMDVPYDVPRGLVSWLDVATMPPGTTFEQVPPGRYRAHGGDDYVTDPGVRTMTLDTAGAWTRFDAGTDDVDVSGVLVGGCIDTLSNVVGTPYCDVRAFARQHAPGGLLVYVEAADENAETVCDRLHGMRLAGFFDDAVAVLVGRTRAPRTAHLTQREAVVDALGGLGVPIVGDVECGHVQPFMAIVNGALGRVRFDGASMSLTQTV